MPVRSPSTATIVVADMVGADGVTRDRFSAETEHVLGDVVADHGGRVVNTGGCGLVAAFDAASQAVEAAVALQERVMANWPGYRARLGAAAGDVSWEDGECFGIPVLAARRLHAAATGGQILVTDVVRALAGERAGQRYDMVGTRSFRDLLEPVGVLEVRWARPPHDTAGSDRAPPPPLPPALHMSSPHRFVGRTDVMASLISAWESAGRGAGRIVLVAGEAGAGKTRLAAELAARLHACGAAVFYGVCDIDLALPFQPWVHVLEQLVGNLPAGALAGGLGRAVAPLAPLVPQLEVLSVQRPPPSDPDTERYRLFAGFVAALRESADRWPTLVVLDDVHWAGAQTLALLRHLGRSGLPEGLLVIATFRNVGDDVTTSLAECLADLRRDGNVARLRLLGLNAGDVERFVADAVGHLLDDELRAVAAGLVERCEGNPFYLGELWRHLVSVGGVVRSGDRWTARGATATTGVPEGVQEVVSGRLSRLTPTAHRIVDLAAVIGQRFELEVLARAADIGIDELAEALSELSSVGLVGVADGNPLASQFAHALARAAVEAAINPIARAKLHLTVALAIEVVHEADRRPVLARLARHFSSASVIGGLEKAMYYGRRAAAQAMRAAAYDEAISHLDTLLGMVSSSVDRAEVLVDVSGVRLRQGRYAEARDACTEAFALAVDAGAADCAARAAVGFEAAVHFPGLPGDTAVDLLRRALALIGDEASPMRPRVLASLGRALAFTGRMAEGLAITQSAVDQSRQAGEDDTLAVALQALIVSVDDPHRQLALAEELNELAERMGDAWSAWYASGAKVRALVSFGRLDEAADALARFRTTGGTSRSAAFVFMEHAYTAVLELAAGNFGDAEAAAERARSTGAAHGSPYDAGVYGLQMFAIRRAQGRLGEVIPVLRVLAATADAPVLWRPGLAALYSATGMLDEARTLFDTLTPHRFASVARDAVWPACLTFLAETCLALGDLAQAKVLYEELTHFSHLNLMAGMTACFGPADRLLGRLADLLMQTERAEEHFTIALALAERSGSPVWTAEVQHDWATTLTRRGHDERAAHSALLAAKTAAALGIPGRWDVHGSPPSHEETTNASARTDGLSTRELAVLRLVADGLSNRVIGQRLFISENTVANHVRAILHKTGCANRTEATAFAARNSLLDSLT